VSPSDQRDLARRVDEIFARARPLTRQSPIACCLQAFQAAKDAAWDAYDHDKETA